MPKPAPAPKTPIKSTKGKNDKLDEDGNEIVKYPHLTGSEKEFIRKSLIKFEKAPRILAKVTPILTAAKKRQADGANDPQLDQLVTELEDFINVENDPRKLQHFQNYENRLGIQSK